MSEQDLSGLVGRAAHARNVGALLTKAAYRVNVHGRHHLPKKGAVVLVAPGLNLVSAKIVASVASRPIHTIAPSALPAMGDIAVVAPGIDATRWALELLAAGAAIMVIADAPPLGYLLAVRPSSVISVVVIGGSGKVAADPPRLRSQIEVYFSAPHEIELAAGASGEVDPCSLRVVQGLSENVRQLAADALTESGMRFGRPVTRPGSGKVH